MDYKVISAPDVDFPIQIEYIETNDAEGPFGAKGVGEPGLVPMAPAIAKAVCDAVGVRIRDLPLAPQKDPQSAQRENPVNGQLGGLSH